MNRRLVFVEDSGKILPFTPRLSRNGAIYGPIKNNSLFLINSTHISKIAPAITFASYFLKCKKLGWFTYAFSIGAKPNDCFFY